MPAMPPEPEPAAAQAALPMSHPEMPELVLSYSRLTAYQNCPRAYQYEHIYHLPTRPTAEQEFGVAVHTALKEILGGSHDGPPPLEDAIGVFDRVFSAMPFCDPINADLWQERGREFIRALHLKGRLSGKELHLPPEQSFNMRMNGFRVQGNIDRIDRTKSGYRLVDYKTGEMREEWQLERDLQLGLYHMAATGVLGLNPVELAICYLEDATEVPVLKTTSQLEADREAAEEAAAGIMAQDFTPRPSPWKCAHCDFRLVCDAAL
jgi:RecB family exonuclease